MSAGDESFFNIDLGSKHQESTLSSNFRGVDSDENTYPSEIPARADKFQGYTIDEAIDKMGYGPFQFLIYLFSGFVWMADAMELMILAILSPAVKCQWSLSSVEEAFITSIVFIGFLFGSIFWGYISDNYGRKKAFIAMSFLVLIGGVLSAIQLTPDDARIPGYPWLLVFRFVVGFGVAGAAQASTYYIEFLPQRARAICTISLMGWFAIGTMFGAALAVGVMGNDKYNWHWYIGLSAIPAALIAASVFFLPESARLLLAKGRKDEAMKILWKIERLNFRSLPPGELVVASSKEDDKKGSNDSVTSSTTYSEDESEKMPLISSETNEDNMTKAAFQQHRKLMVMKGVHRLKCLFMHDMWKTTLPVWVLWFGATWLYYGCVLLTTTMLQENPHCDGRGLNSSQTLTLFPRLELDVNDSNGTSCKDEELNEGDYLNILWTSAAELPGMIVTVFTIEILGRKLTVMIGFLIAFVGFCLLYICTIEVVLTVFFFIIRASVAGLFQAMYAYTPEVYPTKIRGLGIGFASSVGRFGAILTPYVAQVLFRASDYATISVYAGTCLILAFVVLLLPVETKGKSLKK